MNLITTGTNVLTDVPNYPETTQAGLVLLTPVDQHAPKTAKVLAVGPGYRKNNVNIPLAVKPGDTVLVESFGGNAFKHNDKIYFVFKEEEILAIVE
jgi:chaperonin GroES